MPNRPEEPDSLDREVTQAHSLGADSSQADSLDRQQTADSSPSSSSDISQFDEGWEQAEESAGLETRYQIQQPIGHGGMGEVYRAVDNRLKRPVAIKRLKGDLSRNRRAVERFAREAEAVARLNHYNIVQIHDVGRDEQGHYIVMELVEGESLAELLKNSDPLDRDAAIELTGQLCDALFYAHAQGIVHRDVKPANILITAGGVPKLTDFGLARLENHDHGQTRAGAVLGTLDFMSPEQHRDAHRADARSDQWSLAATFYQIVTGESPRVIRSERLPEVIRDVVLKALEEEPAKRFEDCHAFRDALLQVVTAQGSEATPAEKLTSGECGECRHVNDPSMTFCEACGTSLRVPCPACEEQIGVWATFCGNCGADVTSELETRRAALAHQQQELDSLRRSYHHREAIIQLESMCELPHPAFADQKSWAETNLAEYRAELTQLEKQRDEILQAATQRINGHDVEGTLQLLERIPEPLSNSQIDSLREQAEGRAEVIRSLGAQIRSDIASKQLDGLLGKVEQFLELRPHDEALKLRAQLQKREQQRLEAANVATEPSAEPKVTENSEQAFSGMDLPPPIATANGPRSAGKRQRNRQFGLAALAVMMIVGIMAVVAMNGGGPGSAELDGSPDGEPSIDSSNASRLETTLPVQSTAPAAQSDDGTNERERVANATETGANATETGANATETGANATETGANATETGANATKTVPTIASDGWVNLITDDEFTGWTPRPAWTGELWKASAGTVTLNARAAKSYLWTDRKFSDFELALDFRLGPNADAGILLRSAQQYSEESEVFEVALESAGDSLSPPGNPVVGGLFLYHSGFGQVVRADKNAYQPKQWNQVHILLRDRTLQVKLNNEPVFDRSIDDVAELYPRLSAPLASSSGFLGLQAWAGDVEYRNVRLRELTTSGLGRSTPIVQVPPEADDTSKANDDRRVPLFNGRNLDGWTPRIRGKKSGDNYLNTFRVENGLLTVNYDLYASFNDRIGHLFYDQVFSKYRLRFEYRFIGNTCPGAPAWAVRNSGVHIHAESPASMSLEQDYPVSLEVQLLGGSGKGERTTANLATPGTTVVQDGQRVLTHVVRSNSKTYHADEWITVEIDVDGSGTIKHIVDGQTVLTYSQPRLDDQDSHANGLRAKRGSSVLGSGRIAIQSEGHPIQFRRIELLDLSQPSPGNRVKSAPATTSSAPSASRTPDADASRLIGSFRVDWTETPTGQQGTAEYSFQSDNSVLKGGRPIGIWKHESDQHYRVIFSDRRRGDVDIRFSGRNQFNGIHVWQETSARRHESRWIGTRQ